MNKLSLLVAASLVALGAQAEVLSPARALQRVQANAPVRRIASRAMDSAPVMTIANSGVDAELYVFAPRQGGLLVVSAESEAPALLGYSDSFVAGEDMPPGLELMLEAYAMDIADIRAGRAKAAPESRADNFAFVETICRTKWNQGTPFNQSLPLYNGSAPNVGCVPVAMAQVLKAHNAPVQGSGSVSYGWNGTTLSMDFSTYKPDWENMLDKYNGTNDPEVNRKAVADLMKACGYSCQTNFTTGNSGAAAAVASVGLVNNFGYDLTCAIHAQAWYTMDDWNKLVYDEIAAGYPVLYSGQNNRGGGHAFVIDGYDGKGFFHVNWGWGGTSDGYFALSALDPAQQGIGGSTAGYSLGMMAILGIRPERTTDVKDMPLTFFIEGSFVSSQTSTPLGGMAFFTIPSMGNNVVSRCPVTVSGIGSALQFVSQTDGKEYFAHCDPSYTANNVRTNYGMQFPPVTIPSDLPEGVYKCSPAVWYKSADKCFPVHYPVAQEAECTFTATVKNGIVTFGNADDDALKVTDVDLPKTIHLNEPFFAKGSVENTSSKDFEDPICLGLYKPGSTALLANLGVVCSKASSKYTTEFSAKVELKDEKIESGDYELAFYNSKTDDIMSDAYPVEVIAVAAGPTLTSSELSCVSRTADNVEFELKLTADPTAYKGKIYIDIREKSGVPNTRIERIESKEVEVSNTEIVTVSVGGPFTKGVVGQTYMAVVMYDFGGEVVEASGFSRQSFVLDENTFITEVSANRVSDVIYDLSGRRVATPTKGNIYILNNRKIKL